MKTNLQNYRKDIDGLRGIAILAVVIFHIWPELLPGGYLGVDVFFVISGYLITGIMMREIEEDRFSFVSFYRRRVIRLFPALIIVLFAVVGAGYVWLLPDEFISLGHHIAGASLFLSNFLLLSEVGYFDIASTKKVLLHLWSLAVEEQFYLFWPVLLWAAFALKFYKHIKTVFFLIFLFSFITFLYFALRDPNKAFYLPITRFWQITIGSILATFNEDKLRLLSDRLRFKNSLSVIATLLLVLVFTVNLDQSLRSTGQIVASLCTGLLLLTPKSFFNLKFLGFGGLVYVGLISYPLYLWHWPIVVLNRISSYEGMLISSSAHFIELFASLGLACATFHLVESPFKTLSRIAKSRLAYFLVALLFLVGGVGWKMHDGTILPLSDNQDFLNLSRARNDWTYPSVSLAHMEIPIAEIPVVKLGTNSEEVLFLGDSNMEQYYPRVKKVVEDGHSKSAVFITSGGCIPIPNILNDVHRSCSNLLRRALEYSKGSQVKTLVIGAQWQSFFIENPASFYYKTKKNLLDLSDERMTQVFSELKTFLLEIGKNKKVYVLLNIPISERFDPVYMIVRNFPFGHISINQEDFVRAQFDAEMGPVEARFSQVAEQLGAKVINPMDFLCNKLTCRTHIDRKPIYKDAWHMNATYVQDHATFIDVVLH